MSRGGFEPPASTCLREDPAKPPGFSACKGDVIPG